MRGNAARRLALACVVAALGTGAGTAEAQDGSVSGPVEFVKNVPFDWVSGIGSEQLGDYLYLSGTRALSIYDVSDPVDPALVSHVPYGFEFQNEDVSTNGKTLLISESLPTPFLHVWDVSDPRLPVRTFSVPLAGDHTHTCILDCTYSYGSEGTIVDLEEGPVPQVVGNWLDLVGKPGVQTHDVEEVRPGLIVVSTIDTPFFLVDVRDPMRPRLVAEGDHPAPEDWLFHSARWPNQARDPFLLMEAEAGDGPVMTWKVGGTEDAPTFELIDSFTLGSTSHWFDEHPRFNAGGLLVVGWYGEGTRFLEVAPTGKISELGFFKPSAGLSVPPLAANTWAAYWISDDIVYAVDQYRGIDILRYTGALPAPSAPGAKPQAPAAPPAAGGATSDGTPEVRHAAKVAAAVLRKKGARGLRRARRLSVPLQAPGAGTASVTVSARARGRWIPVARGSRRYAAAGPGSVVARVTRTGRRLLVRNVALAVRVDFARASGGRVVATRRVVARASSRP